MPRPRLRILAIAPDQEEREELKTRLANRFPIDSVEVIGPEESEASFSGSVPSLVVLSALTPLAGEEHVIRKLEEFDLDGDVPVLTVPPLAVDARSTAAAGEGRSKGRKQAQAPIVRDPELVMARIGETLAELRDGLSRPRMRRPERIARTFDVRQHADQEESTVGQALVRLPSAARTMPSLARTELARAARLSAGELPYAVSLTTANGVIVQLLNVSTTGLLFESPFKFIPGTETSLQLISPESRIALPSRFVRSEVAVVETRGVTYRTAVRFMKEMDVIALAPRVDRPAAAMSAVADLLVQVASDHSATGDYAGARAAFEAGIREVLPACEVTLRDSLAKPAAGRESVYFTIPSNWGAIMQATFSADHALSGEEFTLLKMASAAAAVLLQFEAVAANRQRHGHVA